jgi:hypothetical protein
MSKRLGEGVSGKDYGIRKESLPDNNPTRFAEPRKYAKGDAFSSKLPRQASVKGGFARRGDTVKDGTRGSSRGETGRWPR